MECEGNRHIGVWDGVRAIAVFFVVWYHFWQQTWLTPRLDLGNSPFKYLGITGDGLEPFVRYGFTFVDMLILLSAACNFLPYARAIVLEEPWPDTRDFYFKRAARILPSYLLIVLVIIFLFAFPSGVYGSRALLWKDLAGFLTFTSVLWEGLAAFSRVNGVLWTVQVEVLYYLMLPWLARLFKRFPAATYMGMLLVGTVVANVFLSRFAGNMAPYVNHFLTFMGVYANGMMLDVLLVSWEKSGVRNRYTMTIATVLSVCCVVWFKELLGQYGVTGVQDFQLRTRGVQSFLFSGFLFFTACAFEGYRKLFSNRVMRAFCAVSYNLYLWHQFIAVKLKEYRIPYWEGDTPPNMTGDAVWQWKYQAAIIVVSLLVAVLTTYGLERPVSRYLKRRHRWHAHSPGQT